MNQPYGIVIDRAGTIYVADRLNKRVRRIDATSGVISTMTLSPDRTRIRFLRILPAVWAMI